MGRRLNQPKRGEGAKLSLRIDFANSKRLGPGKVLLLEAIAQHGSISAAARHLEMSYKRAWDLIEEMNEMFGVPVIDSKSGGAKGGGAVLTHTGQSIATAYREMETEAVAATQAALKKLLKLSSV
jgi:molybdate transport system regulatory protein